MDVLLSVARSVLVPCVCGYAALSVADAAVGNEILKTAKKIMKTVCTALLSAVCVAFTAWLSLTGVVTGTADALAARVTKTAVSAALPVVGSIAVGRGLNARSRGRDAQGNDRDLWAACGGGDLPAARFDARRAVFRL